MAETRITEEGKPYLIECLKLFQSFPGFTTLELVRLVVVCLFELPIQYYNQIPKLPLDRYLVTVVLPLQTIDIAGPKSWQL